MNKYIKTDIEQGLKYLKTGIMNALAYIESGEEKEITFEDYIPFLLIVKCAEERGWEPWSEDLSEDSDTNEWEVNCWYTMKLPDTEIKVCISGCLWKGKHTKIEII